MLPSAMYRSDERDRGELNGGLTGLDAVDRCTLLKVRSE